MGKYYHQNENGQASFLGKIVTLWSQLGWELTELDKLIEDKILYKYKLHKEK